jgi:hypothetical protein
MTQSLKTEIPIVSVPARWPLSLQAETVTSDHVSASCYGRPEDIRVGAIIVPELKLGNVQRHIFGADLVIGADVLRKPGSGAEPSG